MTAILKLPSEAPIRGLRLHAHQPPAGSPAAAKVQWLLGLGDSQRRREAEQKSLQSVAQSVERAVATLPAAVHKRLDAIADMVIELGLAVAREVVGEALERGLVDPTPVVARCLREAVHGSSEADLKIHLHPDDLGPVLDRLSDHPELRQRLTAAELIADASMPRGGVRAETGAGRLRWDPREVLERISQEVRREASS